MIVHMPLTYHGAKAVRPFPSTERMFSYIGTTGKSACEASHTEACCRLLAGSQQGRCFWSTSGGGSCCVRRAGCHCWYVCTIISFCHDSNVCIATRQYLLQTKLSSELSMILACSRITQGRASLTTNIVSCNMTPLTMKAN